MTLPSLETFRALILKRYVEKLHQLKYPGIPLAEICSALLDLSEQLYGESQSVLSLETLDNFADRCANFSVAVTGLLHSNAKPLPTIRTWEQFRNGWSPITPFSVPLNAFYSSAQFVAVAREYFAESTSATAMALKRNVDTISEDNLSRRDFEEGHRLHPDKYDGDPSEYLKHTAFPLLSNTWTPYQLLAEQRRAHMMMVAGSDRGKTQTLEAMICADLQQDNPPGLVIIDSKGDMFRRLSRLAAFDPDHGKLKDRVILIDPRESPALNPFSIQIEGRDEETVSALLSQLAYFFEALFGSEFSGPMRTVLNPLAELMLHIPGANLMTMLDALDDVKQFSAAFPKLSPPVRRYFEKDFKEIAAKATVAAIKGRIHGMMNQCPAFGRMFNARSNSLDMFSALNEGKIVLVSTEEGYLHDASPVFARYIIALATSAALSRSEIAETQRRQAYLYLDEAGPYFDDRTPKLFRTLRSYGLGIVAAFQDFAQVNGNLRSAIMGSTSIKMAAGGSHADASVLYKEMNLEDPSFIFNQAFENRGFTDWACYIRNRTKSAVTLRAPHGYLDSQPRMGDEQYERFRESNRIAVADQTAQAEEAQMELTKLRTLFGDTTNQKFETDFPSGPTKY